jgi:hypothetical protein
MRELCAKGVFRQHGLPRRIVSDWGLQCACEFGNYICETLEIKHSISTLFLPQINNQNLRINTVMDEYLRSFVNYQQENSVRWIQLADFTINNLTSELRTCLLCFRKYGLHLHVSFSQHPIKGPNKICKVNTQQMAPQIAQLLSKLRTEMYRAQAVQSEEGSKSRRVSIPLAVSSKFWHDVKNISTTR